MFSSSEDKNTFIKYLHKVLEISNSLRAKRMEKIEEKIRKLKLNFNDEKLRVFIPACRETVAMRYVSENMAIAFKKIGCDVLFHIQNDIQGCDVLSLLKKLYKFNPHITININHMNNDFLNDEVFNFIWFQDFMPVISNSEIKITLRSRDTVLSLFKDIDTLLEKKHIPFLRQSFCATEDIYFENKTIKRENKIIFIGRNSGGWLNGAPNEMIQEIKQHFENKEILTYEIAQNLSVKYKTDVTYIYSSVIPIIMRELAIEWMYEVSPIPVEVYGDDVWEGNEIISKFTKGALTYGKEVREKYNSAKYVLISQPKYLRNQRLFEGVASGCIPVFMTADHMKILLIIMMRYYILTQESS